MPEQEPSRNHNEVRDPSKRKLLKAALGLGALGGASTLGVVGYSLTRGEDSPGERALEEIGLKEKPPERKGITTERFLTDIQPYIDKALARQIPSNHFYLFKHGSPWGESYEELRIRYYEESDHKWPSEIAFKPNRGLTLEQYDPEKDDFISRYIFLKEPNYREDAVPMWTSNEGEPERVTEAEWQSLLWKVDFVMDEKVFNLYSPGWESTPRTIEQASDDQKFIFAYDEIFKEAWETGFVRREQPYSELDEGSEYLIVQVRKDFEQILEMQSFYYKARAGDLGPANPSTRFIWVQNGYASEGGFDGKIVINNDPIGVRWYEAYGKRVGEPLTSEEKIQAIENMRAVFDRAKQKASL